MDKKTLKENLDFLKKPNIICIIGAKMTIDGFGRPQMNNHSKLSIDFGDFMRPGIAAKMLSIKFNYNPTTGTPIDKVTPAELIEDLSQDGFKDIFEIVYVCDEAKKALGLKDKKTAKKTAEPSTESTETPQPTE